MTAAEFKKKWSRYQGKETSGYSEHFNDLCRLLGQQTPAEADPSGSDFFCFQKRVVKDAELFEMHDSPDTSEPAERGFADVWKKGCFAWEYKGKKKNLDEAYRQLLRYRESLLNPPLLVVCDFDRYIVKTNFNGTVQEVHEFTNDQIDRPDNLRVLRALFENPDFLKPQRTTAAVTEALAQKIAEVAKSLQKRASVELADARNRAEMNFAQRKNLRIARFLNRIVFCMFAEDTRLLPSGLFTEILKAAVDDPAHFAKTLEDLFKVMATGGSFGQYKIRHFNGHLFDDSSVFELNEAELRILGEAAEADWQFIQPSIMGTLFERAMDESQRTQLGAHYTSEADIKTLVEPVLMQPYRREWAKIKGELAAAYAKGKGNAAQRERLAKFQKQLSSVTVLDPACGSGNFLYVSLQLLLGLEKEVITFATQIGFSLKPLVSVPQLKAIEINPYAFELAQVSVQIGYLQWRRDNGFDNDRTPVLQVLDGFQNEDALLVPHFRNKPKTLKEAQAKEHASEDALKFYTERKWPDSDVIVGNPPFLGDKVMRRELGDDYVDELRRIFRDRIPGQSDLCCYWFEKARQAIESGSSQRSGLLATQGIRNGANREVLKRIKKSGDIFFAIGDREWVLNGANVNISMIAFDGGAESERILDGRVVTEIHANLRGSESAGVDLTSARRLSSNESLCFVGVMKGGPFDLPDREGMELLNDTNPRQVPNSDVLRPRVTALDILRRGEAGWIIDFGTTSKIDDCTSYLAPWKYATDVIKPIRIGNRRKRMAKNWWLHGEARPGMRRKLSGLSRILVTPEVSKHRVFTWLPAVFLPDHKLRVLASDTDYWFGVLHSRFHEIWALKQGSRLQSRPCYTPTTCFETFPFPFQDDLQPAKAPVPGKTKAASGWEGVMESRFYTLREEPPSHGGGGSRSCTPQEHRAAIAAAAKELNDLRDRWLNPPEWTVEKILEFPGSVNGPWSRYVVKPDKDGFGPVRYPRIEPRDADCAAKLKKRTLTNLYNERPAWLDLAHKKLDIAVARAYGWNEFAKIIEKTRDGTIYDFKTGGFALRDCTAAEFTKAHERFDAEFAEKILERLLALNLERASEEVKADKVKKPKAQRTKQEDELV